MTSRIVDTREKLKQAKLDNVDEIIVIGKLAKEVNDAKKITTLSAGALAALSAALVAAGAGVAAAPVTGGMSTALTGAIATPVAATIALSANLTVPAIILASVLGVSMIIALFRDYDFKFNAQKTEATFKKKK